MAKIMQRREIPPSSNGSRCLICYKSLSSSNNTKNKSTLEQCNESSLASSKVLLLGQIAEIQQLSLSIYGAISLDTLPNLILCCKGCQSLISRGSQLLEQITALKIRLKELAQVMKETFIQSYEKTDDSVELKEINRIRRVYAQCWGQPSTKRAGGGEEHHCDGILVKQEPEEIEVKLEPPDVEVQGGAFPEQEYYDESNEFEDDESEDPLRISPVNVLQEESQPPTPGPSLTIAATHSLKKTTTKLKHCRPAPALQKIPQSKSKKMFICPICGKEFECEVYELHLNNHGNPLKRISAFIEARVDDQSKLVSFECKLCAKVFPSAGSSRLPENQQISISCDHGNCKCKSTYRDLYIFMYHHKKVCTLLYKEKSRGKGSPVFPCSQCSRSFSRESFLQSHIKARHGSTPLEVCDICGKKFANVKLRKRHTINVHNEKSFDCHSCDKTFKYRRSLREHLNKAHSERK